MTAPRRLLSAALLAMTLASANAAPDGLEKTGLSVAAKSTRCSEMEYTVSDDQGRVISVVTSGEITDVQTQKLAQIRERFYAWGHLAIASMSVVFYPHETEIVITPAAFLYQGVDLATYLPAGLVFFDNARMEYGFRIRANNRYPRLAGVLTTEAALAEEILAAVRTSAEAGEPDPGAASEECSAESPHGAPSAGPEEVDALGEQLRRQQADSARSSGRLDELERRNTELESALEKLRAAVLVLHNIGIFGNINPVHRQGIDRIIELKTENPDLLQEEAAAILRQEDIPMSMHEVFLVYSVYFNEFK